MREPPERRRAARRAPAAARRHLHLLVPAEERRRPLEIVDLGDALLELRERGRHRRVPYSACRHGCAGTRMRREQRVFALVTAGDGPAPFVVVASMQGGSVLVRWRIQTPSAPGIGARFRGGGGRHSELPLRPAHICHVSRVRTSSSSFRRRRWTEAFVLGGSHLAASSRSDKRRMADPEAGDLVQAVGQPLERARRLSARIASSCSCAARLVRTRFAWSAFASRFASAARGGDDRPLLEGEHRVSRAGGARGSASIASRPFAYATAWRPRSRTPSRAPRGGGDASAGTRRPRARRCGARGAATAAPRASRRRAGRRAGRRRGSTSGRRRASAAARAAHAARQDARLGERRERVRVACDVQLVARRAVERAAAVGPDLRVDAELAQERERAPRDRRTCRGRGGARSRRGRAGGRSRRSGRAPRSRRAGSTPRVGAIAASSARRSSESAMAFEREEPALVLDAERAVAADPAGARRRGGRARRARSGSRRRTCRPPAPRAAGRRARRARRSVTTSPHGTARSASASVALERRCPVHVERHVRERDRLAGEVAVEPLQQIPARSRHRSRDWSPDSVSVGTPGVPLGPFGGCRGRGRRAQPVGGSCATTTLPSPTHSSPTPQPSTA